MRESMKPLQNNSKFSIHGEGGQDFGQSRRRRKIIIISVIQCPVFSVQVRTVTFQQLKVMCVPPLEVSHHQMCLTTRYVPPLDVSHH